ncbi:MAG: hypothetical protein AAF674_10730 [Pseudomonadota bacterium]
MTVSELLFSHPEQEEQFWASMNSAIAWCNRHGSTADPQNSLRQFRARLTRGDLEVCSRETLVKRVADARARKLRADGASIISHPLSSLFGGRLLAYFPDASLDDGCAALNTKGFYDPCNTPPHDTWIMMFPASKEIQGHQKGTAKEPLNWEFDFLVSYVPQGFIALASHGILVNPEQCMGWLDEHSHPIVDYLKERGLLK